MPVVFRSVGTTRILVDVSTPFRTYFAGRLYRLYGREISLSSRVATMSIYSLILEALSRILINIDFKLRGIQLYLCGHPCLLTCVPFRPPNIGMRKQFLSYWAGCFQDTRPLCATHGFPALPVTAKPSGSPFARFKADFGEEVSFRLCCLFPGGSGSSFS
jgi:hypothetical protein